MKRALVLLLFCALALALANARAQSPGAAIDAENAAQDRATALAATKADAALVKNTDQDGEIAALKAALADLQARVAALEGGGGPPPSPLPPPVPSLAPRTALNTADSAYWAREDAFINHVLNTGRDYALWVKAGQFDEASARFVAMPASGPLVIGLVREGVVVNAAHYAGKWILDWQGDCDVTLDSGSVGAIVKVGANRIEETYDPALHGTRSPRIAITRIGPGGCGALRFYRAVHEPLLAAGAVFDPSWLTDARRFDIIRPMDWTGVNGDYELAAADRPKVSRPVWFGGRVPDFALIRAAIDSGTELWINAPGLLGVPQALADTLRNRTGTQAARVAAVAAAFDQITASAEPLQWARAFVAELNAQSYPISRPLHVEYDNEVWNFTFAASTELNWGLGQALAARNSSLKSNMRTGYGWQSARLAAAMRQALAEGGRSAQVWTMVIGTQTADVTRTRDALAAVAAFNGAEPMSRYGVATTSYYSGGFRWRSDNTLFGATMTQAAWESRWLSDLAADRAGLKARITAYMLDPASKPQNVS